MNLLQISFISQHHTHIHVLYFVHDRLLSANFLPVEPSEEDAAQSQGSGDGSGVTHTKALQTVDCR